MIVVNDRKLMYLLIKFFLLIVNRFILFWIVLFGCGDFEDLEVLDFIFF